MRCWWLRFIFLWTVLVDFPAFGQTLPGFQIQNNPAQPSLILRGRVGSSYSVLRSTNLPGSAWSIAGSVLLTNSVQPWTDPVASSGPAGFYRAMLEGALPAASHLKDFRMTDQADRTQSLYYYSQDQGAVLMFFNLGCSNLVDYLADFESIAKSFASKGVRFWGVAREDGDVRAQLQLLVKSNNLSYPLIQDTTGLMTADAGAQHAGEVVAARMSDYRVFYQGDIFSHPPPWSDIPVFNWLGSALDAFLLNHDLAPVRQPAQGCPLPLGPTLVPDYSTDIAPILINRCQRCHSEGNIGSWVMDSYSKVKNEAEDIKIELLAGRMPPWHADRHYSVFANDNSLSKDEMGKLVLWIDAGASRGNGPDPLTNAAPIAVDWPLGPPDVILSIPEQALDATGLVDYRYIDVANPFTSNVWLKAAVVKPGNRKVVHHALVFAPSEVLQGLGGYFAGYVPGQDPVLFPAGTAKKLPAGVNLQFQMHYITTGQPETDETQIGLYLAAPSSIPPRELFTKSTFNTFFEIPPKVRETKVSNLADFTFAKRSTIYELAPHMHLRGSSFRYELIYPNGSKEVLLSVPHYEFHWQTLYRLAEPKIVPAGTKLHCTATYDNSELNPDNPDSEQTVHFGEQTNDEMFIGYFNYAETP